MSTTAQRARRVSRPLILVAIVVVVVAVVFTAVLVHRHRVAERRIAASLQGTGGEVNHQVVSFIRKQHAPPSRLRFQSNGLGTAVVMVGETQTLTNTVDIPAGMRLEWYSDHPDPRLSTAGQLKRPGFSYCLSRRGHYWRLSSNFEGTTTRGATGSCPSAPQSGDSPSMP